MYFCRVASNEIGNPLTYSTYALTWSGRQLMEMNRNAGQSVLTFAYNDEGIRTSKKSGSVEHIYTLDGSRIVSETIGTVLLVYLYDESGTPIGLQYRTTSYDPGKFDTYYFEKNIFGDIGAGAIFGFDYCWWHNGASAYSFTIGTSYGVYGGYDYYWCLD